MRLRVREWRERRGWSRRRLAAAVGVHPRTLAGYEAGARRLPVACLRAISTVLVVPIDELVVWGEADDDDGGGGGAVAGGA